MNSKIFITSLVIASMVFISCKKELEPQETTATSELVRLGLAKDTTKPAATAVQNTQTTNPNSVLADTKGLNPAHGQPGHRCDIPVGAPLNTPAQGQTTATQGQTVQVNPNQQNIVTTTTTTAQVKTAKGMNPPHGQPGHRCDIPVGAPLNSPAAKTTASTSTPVSGTSTQNFTVSQPASNPVPALLSSDANQTVAEGMNPPHGQPGHRCDIAVGAPLPKS
ncbi:hypothetical protein J0383_09340 [Flavobacterium endoglycinae]|uniref:Uncharacterized protein n=1 Tax=Flavobacterium endoglycinae TaxID=2816357 RepID=A0ABX7QKC0_9FLAO|nr:hypothetical protein [Flavobacterium endoglycinae]QSW90991.1 hypothetical protein J0383_09340 [Flavobacterium endoglycinae]